MPTYHGTRGNDTLRGSVFDDIFYADAGEDFVYASSGHDTVYGGGAKDVLYGEVGNDTLYGEGGEDVLYGGIGNDVLDGGVNNDRMYGGKHNDTYHVHDAGDQVIERRNEGIDTVQIHMNRTGLPSYQLPENVENLIVVEATARLFYALRGNSLDNHITVSYGSRTQRASVYGGKGEDTIIGSNNNRVIDDLLGGEDDDELVGRGGHDILKGGQGDDILRGGAGNDYLVGYHHAYGSNTVSRNDRDILTGGTGRDTFELAQHSAGSSVNRNPYAYGTGYAVIKDFNRTQDKIRLTWKGNMDGFWLGTGDYDGNGRQDTGIFYSGQGVRNAFIGYVANNTGLSLSGSYFY